MNLRTFLALLAIGATVAAVADPIKYVVKEKGDKVGTFETETTGDADSGFVDDSTITLTHSDKTETIHEIARYGKDGIDMSKTVEVSFDGHELKIKCALSDDGAKLSFWDDDQKDEKDIPLADKTSRADATNFWWKPDKPEVGATVTYQSFDWQEMKWSDVTLKYIGRAKVKIGDQELDSNEIDRTEGDDTSKVYVDDKGDALVIEAGDTRIERVLSTVELRQH